MRIHQGYGDPGIPRGMVVGIGNFDGVHLGHQAVISEVIRQAREAGAVSGLLTFEPHPLALLGEGEPPLIYTPEEKEEILAATGIGLLVRQEFDRAFAALSPERFITRVLAEGLHPRGVVVGHDFRFGAGGGGDVEKLAAGGRARAFTVTAVGEVQTDGLPVRSSRIRELLSAGEVAAAALLLGRPYRLSGEVVRGRGVGRDLGFPTVNLLPPDKLIPPRGVYAGEVIVEGRRWPAAVNIGSPSALAGPTLIEAHILGFEGDLYGRRVDIVFRERLRGIRSFDNPRDLADQIARDVARAGEIAGGVRR